MRTFCSRLHSSVGYLKPLSSDYTFRIEFCLKVSGREQCMDNPFFEVLSKNLLYLINVFILLFLLQNFIFSQPEDYPMCRSESGSEKIIPLQTIDTEYVQTQAYILTKHFD